MSLPLVYFENWDGLVSISMLSLFAIGFTHCVNAFGFLDVHALLRNMLYWGQFVLYLKIPCEAEENQLLLIIVLPRKRGNRIKQTDIVTMFTIKMLISFFKFFCLVDNRKRKLCDHNISWNQTIIKSFRDSFIFRIDCAAWNELRFSQCCD